MSELTKYQLAVQVQTMRQLQAKYFKAKSIASRKKLPENFELAAQYLVEAKAQETKVDEVIETIVNAGEEDAAHA